jgi:hypothetical protein
MRNRLPLVLSVTALIVAVFGATPLGQAALDAVPFAKSANYATLAGNAQKLNGRKSSLSGAPGTIPVVGATGKLAASIGAVGPQGPKGDPGKNGKDGKDGKTATALWAKLFNGAVVASSGVVNSSLLSTGLLELTFNQDVSRCAVTTGIDVIVTNYAVRTSTDGTKLRVGTFLTNGSLSNIPVSVAVFC